VSNDDFVTHHGRCATGRGGRTATSSSTSYGTTSWGRWLEKNIRTEGLTVWWHREVYRRVVEITQNRRPHLPASHFFDQFSSTYATSQAAAVRRQADRDPRVISLARLFVEIRDDPRRLSRERFVSQYDVERQARADQTFSELFAGKVNEYVDPD